MIILLKDYLCLVLVFCCIGNCFCKDYYNNSVKVNNTKIIKKVKNNKIVKILVLDGGGTRGYIQAIFLEQFCKDIGIENLGEYFDLIVGTSIGGINAVALASGIKPYDMITFFRQKSPWIFTVRSIIDIFSNDASNPSNKPNKLQMLYMISTGKPFYKAVSPQSNYGDAKLRTELTNIFQDKLLTNLNTKVLLPAYDLSNCKPVVFTNIKLKDTLLQYKGVKIVDALMASSSFPIYFSDTILSDNNIADGGLFQCNPSILALVYAKKLYPTANKYCILSVGTGMVNLKPINFYNNKIIYNLLPMKYTKIWNIFIQNSKNINDILLKNISKYDSNICYYRFDINLDSDKDCSFDTSTKEFFDYLEDEVKKQYEKEKYNIKKFISALKYVNDKVMV